MGPSETLITALEFNRDKMVITAFKYLFSHQQTAFTAALDHESSSLLIIHSCWIHFVGGVFANFKYVVLQLVFVRYRHSKSSLETL